MKIANNKGSLMKAILTTLIFAATLNALTLDQAIDLALANHPLVREAFSAYAVANEQENVAIANFLPNVGANWAKTDRDIRSVGAVQTTQLKANFNLFKGLADYAELRSAIWTKQARLHEYEATKADLILTTKEAFFGYLKAKDTLQSATAQLQSTKKQEIDAQAFLEQGLIGVYEKREIELELLQSEQTEMKAKSDLALARLELESIIAQPLSSEPSAVIIGNLSARDHARLRVDTNETHTISIDELAKAELSSLQAKMEKNRSELKSLAALLEAQKYRKTKALSAIYPSVDIAITKEYYEYDKGYDGIEDQTATMLTLSWQLNGLIVPYFDRQSALYEQRAIESRLADLKRVLSLQLSTTRERFLLSIRAFQTAKIALDVANEHVQIVRNRFETQLASAAELVDALALRWRAQEQWTTYYYDQLLAYAQLERVIQGEILESAQ